MASGTIGLHNIALPKIVDPHQIQQEQFVEASASLFLANQNMYCSEIGVMGVKARVSSFDA
jgi:hypothetical protein